MEYTLNRAVLKLIISVNSYRERALYEMRIIKMARIAALYSELCMKLSRKKISIVVR